MCSLCTCFICHHTDRNRQDKKHNMEAYSYLCILICPLDLHCPNSNNSTYCLKKAITFQLSQPVFTYLLLLHSQNGNIALKQKTVSLLMAYNIYIYIYI